MMTYPDGTNPHERTPGCDFYSCIPMCADCGNTFTADWGTSPCPSCGGSGVATTEGDD